MQPGARTQLLVWLFVVAAILSVGTSCRITSNDVDRWSHTKQGPKKLIAVLTHDKYSLDLRVDAAMTLVEMKPRNGKRVGIVGDEADDENPGLIAALADLEPGERNDVIERMVPKLVEGMTKPVPLTGQDPSFPYKDTAYALLTYEQEQLVSNEKDREQLDKALVVWCLTDFTRRVDDASQLYGVEQVLKYLKADGVRGMPELLAPDSPKIDLIARLIADLGDEKTRQEASKKLVGIAKHVNSDKWLKEKEARVREANKQSRLTPTDKQFKAQLEQFQQETLLKVFGSMKKVGDTPIVDYLLEFAKNDKENETKRASALAALEGHIVKCKADDCDERTLESINNVMSIAESKDTPDVVREQALRRVGEMPRKLVVEKLYALFDQKDWKIRWMAADLILKMSTDGHLDEFMKKLTEEAPKLAIAEPLQYGFRFAEIKGKTKPADLADKYAKDEYSPGVRTTALAYYYQHGTAKQLSKVTKYLDDETKVPDPPPNCNDPLSCSWECEIEKKKSGKDEKNEKSGKDKKGGKDEKEEVETEVKPVKTIGDFVRYCVKPAMEGRKEDPKKTGSDQKKK